MKYYITDRKSTILCTEKEYWINKKIIALFKIPLVYGVITADDAEFQKELP